MKSFERGLNSRAMTMVSIHINNMVNPKIEVKTFGEAKVLNIEDASVFMTENQAEKLFEALEKELYEETFAEIEDKYMTEKVRADHLEEEIEMLKERLKEAI